VTEESHFPGSLVAAIFTVPLYDRKRILSDTQCYEEESANTKKPMSMKYPNRESPEETCNVQELSVGI